MPKHLTLLEKYRKEAIPALKAQFNYKSVMSVPRIDKVVINIGTGRITKDAKLLARIESDLVKIVGQKPVTTIAKKSIAGFKSREGTAIGMMITLRRKRMYDFIDRLISIALPRSRDFHGLNSKSFDKAGNLNIGIKESSIFPEVNYESMKDIFSFQITVSTTAHTAEEGRALLKLIGFPLTTS